MSRFLRTRSPPSSPFIGNGGTVTTVGRHTENESKEDPSKVRRNRWTHPKLVRLCWLAFVVVVGVVVLHSKLPGQAAPEEPSIVVREDNEFVKPPKGVESRTYCMKPKKYGGGTIFLGFDKRGWKNTYPNCEKAQVVWLRKTWDVPWKHLEPWQRISRIPFEDENLDDKGVLFQTLRHYEERTGRKPPVRIPNTYLLYDQTDRDEFLHLLNEGGGMDRPWVFKDTNKDNGRGVQFLGPHSPELESLRSKLTSEATHRRLFELKTFKDKRKKATLIQEYICNELTYHGHKFDLRIYMLVASLNPLIVYYHYGALRVAFGQMHQEHDFSDGKAHLTNVAQNHQKDENGDSIVSFRDWNTTLHEHLINTGIKIPTNLPPLEHIENQIKSGLAYVVKAFRDKGFFTGIDYGTTIQPRPHTKVQNAFALLGGDFIIDNNLNVWLTEIQMGPGLAHGKYPARREIYDSMIPSMVDIVEEILNRQTGVDPQKEVLPIHNHGKWELIYTDKHQFAYDDSTKQLEMIYTDEYQFAYDDFAEHLETHNYPPNTCSAKDAKVELPKDQEGDRGNEEED